MNAAIRDRVAELGGRFEALKPRERAMAVVAAAMLLVGAWYGLLMGPLLDRAALMRDEIDTTRSRIEEANHQLENQILQYSAVDSEQQHRLAELDRRIGAIDEQLDAYAADLIDPAEMARVLEDVLREQSRLKLIRIRNLEAEPLAGLGEGKSATLYQHGLEIEFTGSYFDCMNYLEQLEALPWRFNWQVLEIDVEDHPQNRFRLAVNTLSFDEEWIGA